MVLPQKVLLFVPQEHINAYQCAMQRQMLIRWMQRKDKNRSYDNQCNQALLLPFLQRAALGHQQQQFAAIQAASRFCPHSSRSNSAARHRVQPWSCRPATCERRQDGAQRHISFCRHAAAPCVPVSVLRSSSADGGVHQTLFGRRVRAREARSHY